MNSEGFLLDITTKATLLRSLAGHDFDWSTATEGQLLFLGMGSSHFANDTIVRLLNRHQLTSRALLASAAELPRLDESSTVVAVSAGGTSVETLSALRSVPADVSTIALTNSAQSPISQMADRSIDLRAGVEAGGVASLTYLASLVALLQLVDVRTGSTYCSSITRAADAIEDIVARESEWMDQLREHAIGAATTYFVAPLERLTSAQQSALMLREGPRFAAAAAETGDWSHIDVYLTKTYDYRLVLFAGSAWEQQLQDWTTQRNSTLISIGAELDSAKVNLRYVHDEDPIVRLLAETTFAELLAARMWLAQSN